MKITNGIDHTQFVQLPYGLSKTVYGNLLDGFSVNNYCGIFTWDKMEGQSWKLGNPKICEWKVEDLNAALPKDILKEDIIGRTMFFKGFQGFKSYVFIFLVYM